MSYTFITTHESISSHQKRPYGDTIYEGNLTFSVPSGQMVGERYLHDDNETNRARVKEYMQLHVTKFVDSDKLTSEDWHMPHLMKLTCLGNGKWYYYITRHYLD
jgi:hypothetical protein